LFPDLGHWIQGARKLLVLPEKEFKEGHRSRFTNSKEKYTLQMDRRRLKKDHCAGGHQTSSLYWICPY
jgi:hypothetical protein